MWGKTRPTKPFGQNGVLVFIPALSVIIVWKGDLMLKTIFTILVVCVTVYSQVSVNVEEATRSRMNQDVVILTEGSNTQSITPSNLLNPVLASKSSAQLNELGSDQAWLKSGSQLNELGSDQAWLKSSSQLNELGSDQAWLKSSSQLEVLGGRYGWGK